MELKTYNGECFEREKLRYLIFFLVVGAVIIGSIIFGNIIGAVIILILTGWYFFMLLKINENSSITIEENWITINKKFYPRTDITGFVLEYHTQKKLIHNIVILHKTKGHEIITINDNEENLKTFVENLGQIIPLLESYEQNRLEKFSRKIKL